MGGGARVGRVSAACRGAASRTALRERVALCVRIALRVRVARHAHPNHAATSKATHYITQHLLGWGSAPVGLDDFSISPIINSNTLATLAETRTDVGIVPRTGLDPAALELLRELLALGLGHLAA